MFSVLRLLDVDSDARDEVLLGLRDAALKASPSAAVIEPTLPGSRNGGNVLVHLRFPDETGWRESGFDDVLNDPAITRVNGATYGGTATRRGRGGVYRALLLRVAPEVDPQTVSAFEHELATMPQYVKPIVAWQLSRVDSAIGASAWTHVFEQEFSDVEGLMGPYLMHPIHWAVVDRWFDPETTDVIIRERVCHSFCTLSAPVL